MRVRQEAQTSTSRGPGGGGDLQSEVGIAATLQVVAEDEVAWVRQASPPSSAFHLQSDLGR